MATKSTLKASAVPAKKAPIKAKVPKIRTFTEEEIEELRETFDLFDEDKSGTIDPAEITKALTNMDLERRNPPVYNIINHLQSYQGPMDFETFLDAIQEKLGDTKSKEGMRKLFDFYLLGDESGTDTIKFDNLKKVARDLGESMNDDELKKMLHHIHVLNRTEDPEGITFEEFYEIVTKRTV
jgi:centrin-1